MTKRGFRKNESRSITPSFGKKGCAFLLLILYSLISLAIHFPAFHNHGPLVQGTSCKKDKCNSIEHRYDHPEQHLTTILQDENAVHSHEPCPACMWQAMAKTAAAHCNAPPHFSSISHQENGLPDDILANIELVNIQQPRAPPA